MDDITSSRVPSSAAISLNSRAPRTSVDEIIVAIFTFSTTSFFDFLTPQALHPIDKSINQFSVINFYLTTMAPLVEAWPPSELPFRSQVTIKDKRRKDFHGDLKGCELLEMLQYHCEVETPVTRQSVTRCWPVERLFRR